MLEIKNLCGGYPGRNILRSVSLNAQAGCITAILGPNGCGKSTLLKTVCGILSATDGQALLDGENLLSLAPADLAQKASYLAQNRQVPNITVGRLVLHGRFPYLSYPRRYREEDRCIARKAMEQMHILDLAETPLNRLSGGQQQKAYIAMTLAQQTDVILLDEPTTYLDISHQLQVLRQARMLADSGRHILMVIHDLAHALETADHIVLMKDGGVVIQGTPEEVYASGALDAVFGIRLLRIQAEGRWHYFTTEK